MKYLPLWIVPFIMGAAVLTVAEEAVVHLDPGSVFRDCEDCPDMVVAPPGTLTMGYDGGEEGRYEGPVRAMRIERAFAAGRFPISNAEYARFVDSTDHPSGEGCNYWDFEQLELIVLPGSSWRDPGHGRPIRDNEPVVCVSWLDSKAYLRWLSAETEQHYRLLSEAEWEYLASEGSDTAYPWGDEPNDACTRANVGDQAMVMHYGEGKVKWKVVDCNDGHAALAPVDAFPPNAFGVYDMIGNSWEWVEDCYLMPYPEGPVDGSAVQVEGECDRRAVRGGAWITSLYRQRPSWRGRDPEGKLTFIFGFRIARDLP